MESPAVDRLDLVVDQMGGRHRSNQAEMVAAVAEAFDRGQVLLIQAGTGTGKSLGYLVPALQTLHEGADRIVVSTATLALQRQLIERDLPAVVATVAPQEAPTFAVLKGRGNYICQARLAGAGHEEDLNPELPLASAKGDLELQATALREWAQKSASGDRDDYPDRLDGRVWRSMSATGRECIGPTRCAFADECFSERAKARANSSDVVVTNHAYLALDAIDDGAYLPEHDYLIVDEAHEFAARTTAAATADLTPRGAERALRAAQALASEDACAQFSEAITGFEVAVLELGDDRRRLETLPASLVDPVAALRDAAHVVVTAIPSEDDGDPAARHRATAAVEEVHDVAGRILSGASEDVIWTGGGGALGLHVAPLAVSDVISERLQRNRAAVLTSATLTLGGSFDPLARELGLEGSEDWRGLDVGSPFDYEKQAILYVAADLPKPGRDGTSPETLTRMRRLVEAGGGRALILLSSWRAVDSVGENLAATLGNDLNVLVQKRGEGVARLVEEFADDETSVLIGTMSLFQGVDVPGRTCQCVIIDRIPFPRPDDPILEARARLAESAGGNGFMQVSIPRAALLLAQASGRLIRRDSDQGVVAVLDSRLATARYGTYLTRSMPPFWPTTNLETALGALSRLRSATVDDD